MKTDKNRFFFKKEEKSNNGLLRPLRLEGEGWLRICPEGGRVDDEGRR